jgi:hypothetical protein
MILYILNDVVEHSVYSVSYSVFFSTFLSILLHFL